MALGRIRTDLALEAKEKFEEEHAEVRGVVVKEDYNEEKDIRTTTVIIETENGAKTMGRPQGVYITLEAPNMSVPDEDYHREISKELAEHMKGLLPEKQELNILVVGLGNRDITPDAMGPDVVSICILPDILSGNMACRAQGRRNSTVSAVWFRESWGRRVWKLWKLCEV